MRKCMFLEVPPELRALGPRVAPALAPPARRPEPAMETRRSDPRKYAREMPASPMVRPNVASVVESRAAALAPSAWWEDPIAVGSLLTLVPPIGLAALWTSKRYSADARWALTVVTALMMCLATAATIAIAAMLR